MPLTPSRRARSGFVLLACLAAVIAMLTLPRVPARAADGCTGPFTIAVAGSNGSSTTQPAAQPLTLTLLAADGSPASSQCPLDGKAVPSAMTYSWRLPTFASFDSVDGSTATLTPNWQGRVTVAVLISQDYVTGDPQVVQLALNATAPAPTIATQPPVTAGQSTVLAGVPNSLSLYDPSRPTDPPQVYAMTWDFGDGTTDSAVGTSISHIFSAPGTYTVRGSFYRDPTHVLGTTHISLAVYAPVVAAFTAPDSAVTGAPVTVDGTTSTSDPDAPVSGYRWDFGDGGRATGPTPAHTYWTTGTFTITEAVTDSLGRTAGTTHDIVVSPAPPSSGGPAPSGTPPVAAFTMTTADPTASSPVSFDGTGSADSDGSIVGYAWTFGDGGTDSRMSPQHTYARPGTYPVTLTVTDDDGLSRSVTQPVTVADAPPAAAFTTPAGAVAGSAAAFDGTGSTDADGSVQQYAWDFGDGGTGTGATPAHPFARSGSYDVVLTVTDDAGLTGTVTHTVTVAKAAPVAGMALPAAAVATSPLTFDGTPSSDADGSITGYAWTFGDGQSGTGPAPTHAYGSPGSYTVALTVTDDDGLTGTTSRTLDVTSAPPVAAFTAPGGAAGVSTAFDGTGSTDPDGSIRSYAWDFGDGHTAIGATPGHTFAEPNTYPVTLTVTDDSGLTDSATHLVTVGSALPSAVFVPGTTAPAVGTPVAFDGSGSTAPGGTLTRYAWTFGDGGTGTGIKPSHTYKAPGSYPVTLTVTDAAGHTASVTHVVNAQWPATDLAVSIGGSVPKAGQYTYRVTVKNLGHAGAHGIVLTNAVDPTQVLAGKVTAPAGMSCGGVALGATGTITCKAPSAVLTAGKSWVVTFTVKQPLKAQVRQVSETSSVRAANPDPVLKNNAARLTTAV